VAFALHRRAVVRWLALFSAAVIIAGWALVDDPHAPAVAVVEAAVDHPTAHVQEVRSIAFDGNELPLARLRELLETHPGEPLDPDRLTRDRAAMARELAATGYLAAQVAPADVTFDASGAAYIMFEIDKGPLFHLRKVDVIGPGKDAAVVTISPGDEAIHARIDQARKTLAEGLARRGRSGAVELSVQVDRAAAAVDVVLTTH
jgi:outer membrane protein assembly factor BamA